MMCFRLRESVQKMTLTNANTSQSEKLTEAAKELRQSVNEKDEQKIAKSLLQVVKETLGELPAHSSSVCPKTLNTLNVSDHFNTSLFKTNIVMKRLQLLAKL